jgi:hypothetical protein
MGRARRPDRDHWLRRIAELDPVADHREIYRITAVHEFPWDVMQALSFALYRTYAVPSIGGLLARTGEFTERPQKRYDDTVLLLDAILEFGLDAPSGRTALRRMNRMHGSYDISNDDMRYVLSTFVVVPMRWLAAYGWRPPTPAERTASAEYYRALGARMGIRDVPSSFEEFETLLDEYERAHFAPDAGGRAVSDATLRLMATFRPFSLLPNSLARRLATALMDEPLLDAFGYSHPTAAERRLAAAALRARSRFVRGRAPRLTPRWARLSPTVRSYPGGYDLSLLGTFPARPESAPVDASLT